MDSLRRCIRLHEDDTNEYDHDNWNRISELKSIIGHEEKYRVSLLMQARNAIESREYEELSRLEIEIEEKLDELREVYNKYQRNIF